MIIYDSLKSGHNGLDTEDVKHAQIVMAEKGRKRHSQCFTGIFKRDV